MKGLEILEERAAVNQNLGAMKAMNDFGMGGIPRFSLLNFDRKHDLVGLNGLYCSNQTGHALDRNKSFSRSINKGCDDGWVFMDKLHGAQGLGGRNPNFTMLRYLLNEHRTALHLAIRT